MLRRNDDSGRGSNSRIVRKWLAPGRYTIEATTFGRRDAGTYRLTVAADYTPKITGWPGTLAGEVGKPIRASWAYGPYTTTLSVASAAPGLAATVHGDAGNATLTVTADSPGDHAVTIRYANGPVTITRTTTITATLPCSEHLGTLATGRTTRTGTIAAAAGCASAHRGTPAARPSARWHTFTLDSPGWVDIDLAAAAGSSLDPYVLLLAGHASTGSVAAQDDNSGTANAAWFTLVSRSWIARSGSRRSAIGIVSCSWFAYNCSVDSVQMTARHVPRSIAPIVQELELRQPQVVTAALLEDILRCTDSRLGVRDAADRLTRARWLIPLRTRRAWEFAPAARAAPVGSGDSWIELRALLHREPGAPVAVAFASAVWELGCAMHSPSRHTYAHRPGWRPPRALNDMHSVTYDWRFPAVDRNGLPVWQAATVVVAIAAHPVRQRNWANAESWLPEIMHAAAVDDVLTEAAGRSVATLARLGHLARWSHHNDTADAVKDLLPAEHGVTYLGPRDGGGVWHPEWRVYDAYLPPR